MDYKSEIIRLVEQIENDEKFLKQIFTIIIRHTRKGQV